MRSIEERTHPDGYVCIQDCTLPNPHEGACGLPAPNFETKDSGAREEFNSGMVRDTNDGKPRFDLLIPKGVPFEDLYLTRVARLYERGAQKYAPRNWEKANSQEELDRALESAFRHFMQWYAGETDEDHAAAVFFNINEAETIRWKQQNPELKKLKYQGVTVPRSLIEDELDADRMADHLNADLQ